MPCNSYSLPAQACVTGAKLAKVKGSVCHGCYALKGFYNMPSVKSPRETNLNAVKGDLIAWAAGMIETIRKNEKSGFFRWHDSGDVQSYKHLLAIISIANALPSIKFWLPTKEKALLSRLKREAVAIPDNLIIRLSMAMIDQAPNKTAWPLTSTVHAKKPAYGVTCQAYQNDGKCGACRECWNKNVTNISYPKH